MTESVKGDAQDEFLRTVFLERIAHELRGPAGVSLGALDELELSLEPEQLEKIQTLLRVARRGSERILRTAEKLERAAQLERGRVEWALEPRDIRELVDNASALAEQAERRKNINLTRAHAEAECLAVVDSAWVTNAICELVINAIRHARRSVTVSTSLAESGVTITITDDGQGFAAVPGPRFQSALQRGGLGLSLQLARDVAQSHGGQLLVELVGQAGAGTREGGEVRLVLPRSCLS